MKEGEISLSLKFKKAMDGWNNTFITGDPSHLPNIVTDDFVCRPTEGNESLAQVLEWATNSSSVLGDYKVIHEDEQSLCGFHSVVSPEKPEKRTKVVYLLLRDAKMALHHCNEIVPD